MRILFDSYRDFTKWIRNLSQKGEREEIRRHKKERKKEELVLTLHEAFVWLGIALLFCLTGNCSFR